MRPEEVPLCLLLLAFTTALNPKPLTVTFAVWQAADWTRMQDSQDTEELQEAAFTVL